MTTIDTAVSSGMNALLSSMTSAMALPITVAASVYYVAEGLKFANGDQSVLQNFVPRLIRIAVVIWLSSNLAAFNQWVTSIVYVGLPAALNAAVSGPNTSGVQIASGVTATAAVFDQIWAQMWMVVGTVWSHSRMFDFGAKLAGLFTGITASLGLLVMALVYIGGRLLLAVMVVALPVAIGCAIFDTTRPIFERAVGKVVSLIALQFMGILVLELVLAADQTFMAQIVSATTGSQGAAQASELVLLVGMVVMFLAGAFCMYSLPALAYSIGTGIAVSTGGALLGAAVAVSATTSAVTKLANGIPAYPKPSASPDLNLSVARPPVADASMLALAPPPPPPSLSTSTRSA